MKNPEKFNLIYEENFEEALGKGEWKNKKHHYSDVWYPFDAKTSARNPNSDGRERYLTGENAYVENGEMIFLAEDRGDAYYGVELRTNKYYKYGYFEIDAKIQSSRGICPAFWLVGSRQSDSEIEYELDVFECFGGTPDVIKVTPLAHNYPNREYKGTESRFVGERLVDVDVPEVEESVPFFKGNNSFYRGNWGDDYHKIAIDWRPNDVTWYIDDTPVFHLTPSNYADGKYIFNEPMVVILTNYSGVDVCSPRTGLPDETTDWENGNKMFVRSIKFYEYKE